ncbi:hypothetical protein V1507DRAFT_445744 [Lipomyces tetrasporus]
MASLVRNLPEACSVTVDGEFVSKTNSTILGSLQSLLTNMMDISLKGNYVMPCPALLSIPYTIASVLNSTYGSSLFGRDVYNRTYDYYRENKSSTARFIETLRDEGYIYSVKVSTGNTLEALFFCKPADVQRARLG